MTVGIVMLVHADFDRAAQIARHWVDGGCPVVIHIDKKVSDAKVSSFKATLADIDEIKFSERHKCEWGMWGLVAATQDASELLLQSFPNVRHVYLSSGSCIPLRPVQELVAYLDAHADTDFIESATIEDVTWTVDGLEEERFTLRFPFSWRKQRRLFDRYVSLQRRLRVKRKLPFKMQPHIGSQWWCLTRETLEGVLKDPLRGKYDKFFSRVWIPDESYFQTLSRTHSRKIESRSLTLSKFDFQGKPHIFYDDHLQLLRRSDCFVARKIWSGADKLYETFLRSPEDALTIAEPQPEKIDRLFSKATERRVKGRHGLVMQSRIPNDMWRHGKSCREYAVFEGFDSLFEDFIPWLKRTTELRVHGHLFNQDIVEFADGETMFKGGMSNSKHLRDYDPTGFLRNLIWNARDEHQAFQFGPQDNQSIHWEFATDPNACVAMITGAWLIDGFRKGLPFEELRKTAAKHQKIESTHRDALQSGYANAKSRIWTLAEFLEAPAENLSLVMNDISPGLGRQISEAPKMVDLTGFGAFVQNLKNEGMNPFVLGDFRQDDGREVSEKPARKPYLVR